MTVLRKLYFVLAVFGLLVPVVAQADHRHHNHIGYANVYVNGWYFNYGYAPFYQTFPPPVVNYQWFPQEMSTREVRISCPMSYKLISVTDMSSGRQGFTCKKVEE